MFRAFSLVAACSIVFIGTVTHATEPTSGETVIHAVYTIYQHRTTPVGEEFQGPNLEEINLVLSGHTIRQTHRHESSKGRTDTTTDNSTLGRGTWRVVNSNRLQEVVRQPQEVVTTTIDVSGSTCQLSWGYQLLPGFTDLVLYSHSKHDFEHYAPDIHLVNSVCSIKSADQVSQ